MSISASVVDGKVVDTTASSMSLSKETEKKGNALDKEAFLQLLVAEMQNQDPLQPTTNTEYVSQFATFSQLEEMQNVSSSVDMQRAQAIVGKEVFLDVTNSSGETTQINGRVDYVVMEAGKVYVSVDDSLYKFEDVTTVLDAEYWDAYNLAYAWSSRLSKVGALDKVTLGSKTDIMDLKEEYDAMTDYQKTFIAGDSVKLLEAYVAKIDELQTISDNNNANGNAENQTEDKAGDENADISDV